MTLANTKGMIHRGIQALLALLLTAPLPSCGKSGSTTGSTPAAANRAPTATITVSSGDPIAGVSSVSFTVAVTDPDGDTTTQNWNFGDGTTGSGMSVTHIYANAGTFNVVVTVADSRGASTTASASVSAKTLSGFWRSEARAWNFEIVQTGTTIGGRLLGFRNVTYSNPPALTGRVTATRSLDFQTVDGVIGFTGTVNGPLTEAPGTLNELSRNYGEILKRQ